ncbi:MAG: hypothetical protein AB2596_21500 [Candidatus Thiodiazotropha sp.]
MLSNKEVTEGLLMAVLGANFVLLFFIAWHVVTACLYFRRVRRLVIAIITGKMDCDELIDGLLSTQGTGDEAPSEKPVATTYLQSQEEPDRVQKHRERLASVAAGGQAGRYGLLAHGKALTASHIEELDDSEIERLYARYEARLGAAMTKTLGSAALQLYAGVVSLFLPIPAENQPGLIADLEGDPFVGHALSSATCELYHRYGMFLAPLTAALTTIKHCQFGHRCPAVIKDGGEPVSAADNDASPDVNWGAGTESC